MSMARAAQAFIAVGLAVELGGCAGGGAPASTSSAPPPPPPLTADEVEKVLGTRTPLLADCYMRHRLQYGLEIPSDYVVRFTIPSGDAPPFAEIREASQPGQEEIEVCVVEVFETTPIRRNDGDPLVLDVPVRAPSR